MLGGIDQSAVWQAHQYVKEIGGKPQARVVGYGTKVPASQAAFVNGVMARALDLGDYEEQAAHSSEYVVPPIMAVADAKKSNGKDVILAMALGSEVLARLGHGCFAHTYGLDYLGKTPGIHPWGAICAVGKLYHLDKEQLWDAIGIGLACPGSTDLQSTKEGRTGGKRLWHAFVAGDAVTCAELAKIGGIEATRKVFFGERGFLATTNPYKYDLDVFTKDLGKKWVAIHVQKKYTCCGATHGAIDGTFEIFKEHKIKMEDIDTLEYVVWYSGTVEPREEKWNPQNMGSAQFSLPYVVATALLKNKVFIDDFTDEELFRKDVRELMTKIKATADPGLGEKVGGLIPTRIKISLKDGRVYAKDILYPPGHPKLNPLTWEDLANKFRMCADYVALPKSHQEKAIAMLRNLESVEDTSKLIDSLIIP